MDPKDQFQPNDYTLQVNYTPNPLLLDNRGGWTAAISKQMSLPTWQIAENQLFLFNDGRLKRVLIALDRCNLTIADVSDPSHFTEECRQFIEHLFGLTGFPDPLFTSRIGVKAEFFTPYRQSFSQLQARVKERYVDLKSDAYQAVGTPSKDTTDVGAPFYFKDDSGEFKSYCGPMLREQAKSQFFRHRAEDDLPAVGLFYSNDCFDAPKADMTAKQILEKVATFSDRSWLRHQRIRKLIVG